MRYILTHLKYLHEGGKADLLKNRPLCTSLFHFLQNDPPDVMVELLTVTEQYVLKDDDLPRSAKAALLIEHNLERVAEIATRYATEHEAPAVAFAWLKCVCTQPSYGVLRMSGWYPPGTTNLAQDSSKGRPIDLGINSLDFYDRDQKPNIRNTVLLAWMNTLRPHINLRERELVLTCFRSAPELVAAYLAEKNMQLEPKLSNTWIGYASFLFEIVQLPLPSYLGHEDDWAQLPPQTYIMLDSIIPRPLTHKVLTRCLNQNSDLIRFFAIRMLILALEKLSQALLQLAKGAKANESNARLWKEAAERLHSAFAERFPAMKDTIVAFRKIPNDDEHLLQQEAATRLLRLCYEVLPLQAMAEPFDVSVPLTEALVRINDEGSAEEAVLRSLRLQHLLQIARRSSGMRWLSKQGALEFSPIMTLLKIHAQDSKNKQIRDLLFEVLSENNILKSMSGLDALVAILHHRAPTSTTVPSFLDDCFVRAGRKPVKYLDDLEALEARGQQDVGSQRELPSILVGVLLEQAPFILTKTDDEKVELMDFVNGYLELLLQTEEGTGLLQTLHDYINITIGLQSTRIADPELVLSKVQLGSFATPESDERPLVPEAEDTLPFSAPPEESENHPELLKWSQKDLALALEDGDIAALILCLSSQYPEIRSQALTQLYKLEDRVLHSNLDDKDPIYILLGELIETYEQHIANNQSALPHLATCFATHALKVQMQPIHYMYPKINKFLNKGPGWRASKLPTYWFENTVLSEPEEDDRYWKEVQWVLGWLVDALRTTDDLEILRKGGVFEKVMSLYGSPGSGLRVKEKVLEMLWRVTLVEGGSTTLVTRAGVLSWSDMVSVEKDTEGLVRAVRKKVVETCDRVKVEEWSGLMMEML